MKYSSCLLLCLGAFFSMAQTTHHVKIAFGDITDCAPLELPQVTSYLFPNPANDWVKIPSEYRGSEAVIFDTTGRLLYRNPAIDSRIDVGHISSGLYIIHIITTTERRVFKLKIDRP